jgi:transposase-like protein
MNEWAVRPLDENYVAIFIDAIALKVRDGLGSWGGTGGKGAKSWMSVLTDLRNRDVRTRSSSSGTG